MKLYIPEIGDQLRLTEDWTFGLYNEDRNETLMEKIGDRRKVTWGGAGYSTIPCTIPAGATLKVDRIYIRKGISEYSSITFLWVGERTEPRMGQKYWSTVEVKIPRKPVRFWAKLDDVNNIEFDKV
jgi:hypothetical protein